MSKLSNLKPSVGKLPFRLSFGAEPSASSGERTAEPTWRRWYHTARWTKLRMDVLVRDLFTCRMCGRLQTDTSKLVADHRRPHRGNAKLFWHINNIQTLCADPCHNAVKKAEEAATHPGMWD